LTGLANLTMSDSCKVLFYNVDGLPLGSLAFSVLFFFGTVIQEQCFVTFWKQYQYQRCFV